MNAIERFSSKQLYLCLPLAKRKIAKICNDMNRRRNLVLFYKIDLSCFVDNLGCLFFKCCKLSFQTTFCKLLSWIFFHRYASCCSSCCYVIFFLVCVEPLKPIFIFIYWNPQFILYCCCSVTKLSDSIVEA